MAEARIDVQVEHKHAPPPSEKKHPNTCPRCGSHYRDDELEASRWVCAHCGHHFPMGARARIEWYADEGTFVEEASDVRSDDPLEFFDLRPYAERLSEAELNTGLGEAMVVGQAALDGHPVELAVMDFSFMGGSMGSAVGEKFSRACDSAIERGVPLISVTSSGGARMQEGILSLMQLPKTVCAVEDLHDAKLPMFTVMAHPTTAGVLASFASLGDVTIAEPGALIAFTGPRVVQQTTREKLPDDFGLAEQNLRFGHLDAIVPRDRAARVPVAAAEAACVVSERDQEVNLRQRLSGLSRLPLLRGARVDGEAERLERQLERLKADTTDEAIWRSVELARHQDRPYTLDYVERMLDDWVELHGDRGRADDGALVTGIGSLDGKTIVLVGHQKGRDVKERLDRQFGMAYPEGYHKAMRVMEIAERFGFPFVALVDTPGAYPGVAAEQHGQGGAIARSQAELARLTVPTVACIIGEGGSGGAVALAVTDRVLMQENAIYSVITPEGCAAILWRDAGEAKRAAAAFKPDAAHCLSLGVIDSIVPEPRGRRTARPRRGRPPVENRARRDARRARGHARRGAEAPPAGEIPRYGRLRLAALSFHIVHRVFNRCE